MPVSSASFGKRQEFVAISELLRQGHDVYLTLVDDKGIDCVVRSETGSTYLDMQVKARSKDCVPKDRGFFAAWELKNPRSNYWFLFYSEELDDYWVIPSLKLDKLAHINKQGKNPGKRSILLATWSKKQQRLLPRPKFSEFQGDTGFQQLIQALTLIE